MRPAKSRRWRVGDTFYYNRWSEQWPTPLTCLVTKITATRIYFWDGGTFDKLPTSRSMPRREFYSEITRRILVRGRP